MIERLSDFLSPVLVKESRQGLRSRTFVLAFLVVQPLIILFLLFSMVNRELSSNTEFTEMLFWGTLFLVLGIVMPLRGITAISDEVKANSFELLKITHLSAYRIVSGKWAALYTQILLLTVAIIPYIAVRYFLGGIDLVGNIMAMVIILLIAAAVLAIALLISSFASPLLRIIAVVGLLPMLWGTITIPFGIVTMGLSSMELESVGAWLALIAGTALIVLLILRITASQIAAIDDSQTAAKRILWLLTIAFTTIVSFLLIDHQAVIYILIAVTPFMVLDAFLEKDPPQPYLRRRLQGWRLARPLGWLLVVPGWRAGSAFYCISILICATLIASFMPSDGNLLVFLITIMTATYFPVFVTRTFYGGSGKELGIYLCVIVGCLMVSGIIGALQTLAFRVSDSLLAGTMPVTSVFILTASNAEDETRLLLASFGFIATVLFLILSLLAHSRRQWAQRQREQARATAHSIASRTDADS